MMPGSYCWPPHRLGAALFTLWRPATERRLSLRTSLATETHSTMRSHVCWTEAPLLGFARGDP